MTRSPRVSSWLARSCLALLAAGCAPRPERPNVLLVTIDTLRADHLGCYGYARDTTPNLDRLAAQGLRFSHAQSPRAKTTPAIASLLTGLYPHQHGVRDLLQPLSPDIPLLQESLRAAGYSTGALVGNWVLSERNAGLRRGFDLWVESLPDVRGVPPDDAPQRTARSLTDGALVALGLAEAPAEAGFQPRASFLAAGRPWFLWLHYMDPHGAYAPPEEQRVFRSPLDPIPDPPDASLPPTNPPHPQRVARYNVPDEAVLPDGRIDAGRVRDLYDAEIRYVDAELGRLLDRLRVDGLLGSTLVIVSADHGESLGEHRYWFEHGMYPYENTCRVPLIVRPPDGLREQLAAGVRRGDVSLCDLAPTLLDLLGAEPLARAGSGEERGPRGASRLELWTRDDPRPRPVYCEKVERAGVAGVVQSKAVREGDWKLIARYAARAHPERPGQRDLVQVSEELYDLAADPLERVDLAARPPANAPLEKLRAELAAFTRADADLLDLGDRLQLRREALERDDPGRLRVLEALGY